MTYASLHLPCSMSLRDNLLASNYFADLSFVCCLLSSLVKMSIGHSLYPVKMVLFLLLLVYQMVIVWKLGGVRGCFLGACFRILSCLFYKLSLLLGKGYSKMSFGDRNGNKSFLLVLDLRFCRNLFGARNLIFLSHFLLHIDNNNCRNFSNLIQFMVFLCSFLSLEFL